MPLTDDKRRFVFGKNKLIIKIVRFEIRAAVIVTLYRNRDIADFLKYHITLNIIYKNKEHICR